MNSRKFAMIAVTASNKTGWSFKKVAVLARTTLAIVFGHVIEADIRVKAVTVLKEQMRLDFADSSKHFMLAVRRESTAEGNGPFARTRSWPLPIGV